MLAFLIPAVILVVAVQFYPLAYSAFISTQDWSLTRSQTPQGFIGLTNFVKASRIRFSSAPCSNSLFITGVGVTFEIAAGHDPRFPDHRIELVHPLGAHAPDPAHGHRTGGGGHPVAHGLQHAGRPGRLPALRYRARRDRNGWVTRSGRASRSRSSRSGSSRPLFCSSWPPGITGIPQRDPGIGLD